MRNIKKIIKFLLHTIQPLMNLVFRAFPTLGVHRYNLMQKYIYRKITTNKKQAEEICVGHFEAHEAFPYEEYLLEYYPANKEKKIALDFGCGPGRMVTRMLSIFDEVHGVDLVQSNLDIAKQKLIEDGFNQERFSFFKTSGTGEDLLQIPHRYDFIFSTICLQHIPVHLIRMNIFKQIFSLLKDDGYASLQMGYGWDNGVYWRDNNFNASTSNGGSDISIPDESHFSIIKDDLCDIGFDVLALEIKDNPHPYLKDYHSNHLFIHLKK